MPHPELQFEDQPEWYRFEVPSPGVIAIEFGADPTLIEDVALGSSARADSCYGWEVHFSETQGEYRGVVSNATAMSETLNYLNWRSDRVPISDVPQMMEVNMSVTPSMNMAGYPIEANLSPSFARWVRAEMDGADEDGVTQAMIDMDSAITQRIIPVAESFFSVVRDPRGCVRLEHGIQSSVGPDYTGLGMTPEKGYRLVPSNPDSAVIQVNLLAGLAKISELARAHYAGQ